jgi:hypothetical protein
MLYIQIKDGKPYQYPILHNNLLMLIPSGIIHSDRLPVPDDIFSLGYTIYITNPKPEPTGPYVVVEEADPVLDEQKYAQQTWVIRDMTAEERADKVTELQMHIKKDRFYVLDSTQWIIDRHTDEVLMDRPTSITQEQLNEVLMYRQALRELDYSDPLSVTWPTAPSFVKRY